jgi:hypothetical protein
MTHSFTSVWTPRPNHLCFRRFETPPIRYDERLVALYCISGGYHLHLETSVTNHKYGPVVRTQMKPHPPTGKIFIRSHSAATFSKRV